MPRVRALVNALRRLCVVSVAATLLAACEHAQPFGGADLGPNVPFSQDFPRRLTFNPPGDIAPAWLPDGSGIIYSYQRLDRADHDRCLGILPAEGGHIGRSICHRLPLDADSTNTLWEPSVGPGSLLAYVRESSGLRAPAPQSRELVVAALDDPEPGRVVRSFPYTAPGGSLHEYAAYLHWVDDHTLVYLAEHVAYTFPPLGYDTLYTPIEIAQLTLSADSVVVSVVPGTLGATSVTVDTAGAICYTRSGDSRVYRIARGGSAAAVLFDFGGLGSARDVQVRSNTLVAVVGGALYRVDLAASAAVPIPASGPLGPARPALSPSGARVVAESRRFGAADLWLLQVP